MRRSHSADFRSAPPRSARWPSPPSRCTSLRAAEEAVVIPPPRRGYGALRRTAAVVVAGGCFWGCRRVQHTSASQRGFSATPRTETPRPTSRSGRQHRPREAVQIIKYDPKRSAMARSCRSSFRGARSDPVEPPGSRLRHAYRSASSRLDDQKKVTDAYIVQLNAAKSMPSRS